MRETRRVVVTGGAGFVGSHLCESLLADGLQVVCVDNLSTGSRDNLASCWGNPAFEFIEHDIVEPFTIDGAVDGVLHLASPASPADYQRDPIGTLEVGSIGTLRALRLAEEKGARLVYASTSEVYGDPLVHPQTESYWGNVNPVGPRSMYDEAKRFGEAAVAAFRSDRGVNAASVRIFNTFGPRMRAHDGRAIPTFITQALAGEPITVSGDGTQTRSICFVTDLVAGLRAMLDSDHPGPINLGNPHELTMRELAQWIRDLTGSRSPLEFIPRPGDDPEMRRPDVSTAEVELDWRPTVSAEAGLRATIDWFRIVMQAGQPLGGERASAST